MYLEAKTVARITTFRYFIFTLVLSKMLSACTHTMQTLAHLFLATASSYCVMQMCYSRGAESVAVVTGQAYAGVC